MVDLGRHEAIALDAIERIARPTGVEYIYETAEGMRMNDYQRGQDVIARAEGAQRRGDVETARAAYADAAAIQGAWVATLDPSVQPRTKSIYTASVVALYYKAGEIDKARTLGEEALAQPWLIDHAAMRIREVLDVLPPVQQTPPAASATGSE